MAISILFVLWISLGIYGVSSQSDSLRSALNAVDRRQRYYYENPDISYLPNSDAVEGNDFIDFLPDDDTDVDRKISSFRERQEDKEKQLEELSQRVLYNLENDDFFDNSAYRPRDQWRKYRNNYYNKHNKVHTTRKRQFYPEFGYDSIGLRKRDKLKSSDYPNEYNYFNLNDDSPSDYIDDFDYSKRIAPYRDRYDRSHQAYRSNFRHIPVTKRSSEYPKSPKDKKEQNQPTKTDPKVEKDLKKVFSEGEKQEPLKKNEKGDEETKENQTKQKSPEEKPELKKNGTKKDTNDVASAKPIQISKKSIDWSDYFGLDRRKKSKDDFDKEWLRERYHNAISVSKKNTEYPLQSFHDHDSTTKSKKDKNELDDSKLENLDRKLKTIEDEIVDDALKYTGANEGVTEPKDIREVEDGIISRLAKAYSIEKMRRALGEYKILVDKEREKFKKVDDDPDEDSFSEMKRVSVPRKQAVDPNKDDKIEDNHIKCSQAGADCEEENYKTPIEVIEQMNYDVGGCPKIQRDCRQVAPLLGQFAKIFEEACNTHQMCLLCGNNNWYPATRQCNILFLGKIYDACEGKIDCQKELEKSIHLLININRNIRNNPTGDCNILCPDGPDGPLV